VHGLGHIQHVFPKRARRMIDVFLANRPVPDWLREYARRAREGAVQ
jgi:hypothetical protein